MPLLGRMQGLGERARRPLEAAAALGAGFTLTGSFKMQAERLQAERYLLTISKARIGEGADARILEACRALGMPQIMLASFAERLAPAGYVHFGFEQAGSASIHKLYLEYWTTWEEELELKRRSAPFVGGYGYKWETSGGRSALTRYTCHPRLPPAVVLERVEQVCRGASSDAALQAVRALFAAAAPRMPAQKLLYLEAEEETSARRSFDLNLLRARLPLGGLRPLWQRLAQHYRIAPDALEALVDELAAQPFAHIQGGVDRDGGDFVTIYYGCEEH